MSKQIKLWFTLFPFSHQTIQSSASDWGAAAFGPLGPVHMCPIMCLVPLPLFNQFIMLSLGLYSIRSGPSTWILTRLDKASCFMLVLAVVLILLTELKPLLHSAFVGEIVSIMRIRIIICSMCCASAEFISPTRGVLFNQLVYCMAIFTNKTSEDIYCYLSYNAYSM